MFEQRIQTAMFLDKLIEFEKQLLPEGRLRLLNVEEKYDAHGEVLPLHRLFQNEHGDVGRGTSRRKRMRNGGIVH